MNPSQMNVLPLKLFPLLFEWLRMHSFHATSVTSLVISLVTRICSLSYLPSSVLMMCSSSSVSSCTEKQNKTKQRYEGLGMPMLPGCLRKSQCQSFCYNWPGGWLEVVSHSPLCIHTHTFSKAAQFFIRSNMDLVFRMDISSKQNG